MAKSTEADAAAPDRIPSRSINCKIQVMDFPEQFTVKAQDPLYPTWLYVPRDCLSVQMAAIEGRHLVSVTRCKTVKAAVKPFICIGSNSPGVLRIASPTAAV